MSGTRSPSPPEQATRSDGEALLIIAHGETAGRGMNTLAMELARRVSRAERFDEVAVGFIRGEPSIEDAAVLIRSENLRVFPLFMSEGYYVRTTIPTRLGLNNGIDAYGHKVTIEQAFGIHPEFPQVLLKAVEALAAGEALDMSATTLLLVAHGSKNTSYSRDAAARIRDAIAEQGKFRGVSLSFIEEAPFFQDVLAEAERPAIVLGLLIGEGMHTADDVKAAVQAQNDPQIFLLERFGSYADIIEFIHNTILMRV